MSPFLSKLTSSCIFILFVNLLFSQSVHYVDIDASGLGDGTSWIDAYNDLQEAMNSADKNDAIWVAEGTYVPLYDSIGNNSPLDPREKMFYVDKDLKIYGGFTGVETSLGERDFRNNETILSGVINNTGTSADSVYHVFYIKGGIGADKISYAFIFDGFTITGGLANENIETYKQDRGAGLYIDGDEAGVEATPIISNCTFRGNKSYLGGGGMLASGLNDGFAFPVLYGCNFEDNFSHITGSAIWIDGKNGTSRFRIFNSRIFNNRGEDGIYRAAVAGRPDGGYVELKLINTTIASNFPAGILAYDNEPNRNYDLFLWNSILFNNTVEIESYSPYDPFFQSSLIGVDPNFVDLANGDLRLQDCSPAINTGNNSLNNTGLDLDGQSRKQSGTIDIGAFESSSTVGSGSRKYVDLNATGCGNGSSWADAFSDLQDAIDACEVGDTIWVAKGIYLPKKDIYGSPDPEDFRDVSFYINKDIKIFGGFAGTESSLSQRDFRQDSTILSGNIQDPQLATDNAYNVVSIYGKGNGQELTRAFELDGFYIVDGYANKASTSLQNRGAGILINARGLTNSMPNTANPTIRNCTFSNNYSLVGGSGLIADATPNGYANPLVVSCVFENNSSEDYGSAIMANADNNATINIEIVNSRIFGNTGLNNGRSAAISGKGSNGIVEYSLTNCSVASNFPAGIYGFANASSLLTINLNNSILFDNNNTDVQISGTVIENMSNSLVGVDPLFTDLALGDLTLAECSPAINAGDNGLINLAVDLSGNDRVQNGTVDIGAYEAPFTITPTVSNIIYVDQNATGCLKGTSWEHAYTNFQQALDRAQKGDTIWIAAGTYIPTKDISGDSEPSDPRKKTFYIDKDLKIFGGFAGSETLLEQRDFRVNETILSGKIDNTGSSQDSVYHVVYVRGLNGNNKISNECIIDGLTIQDGRSDVNQANIDDRGAGLILVARGSSASVPNEVAPIIRNCTFKNNFSTLGGAGVLADGTSGGFSNPTIISCNFENNHSDLYGAGFWADARFAGFADAEIINSRFYNNTSLNQSVGSALGGNEFSGEMNIIVTNTSIAGNNTHGIYMNGSSTSTLTVSNSLVFGNGTDLTYSPSMTFTNNHSEISNDPFFMDLDNGDLRLKPCSPFINAGDHSLVSINVDLDGDQRIQQDFIDLGCYEMLSVPTPPIGEIIYVNIEAEGCATGANWEHAFTNLQDAIDIATPTQEIWVAQGTYKPSKNRLGAGNSDPRNRTFIIKSDVKIYGGFDGTETQLEQRDSKNNMTVLNGDLENQDFQQAYNVIYIDARIHNEGISSEMILDGFTIRSGASENAGFSVNGGGIYMNSEFSLCSPIIRNCSISNNLANHQGGGVYINAFYGTAFPTFLNCVFKDNYAIRGAGVYNDATFGEATPKFINCLFDGNRSIISGSPRHGGGVYNFANEGDASPELINCTFVNNTASQGGGAIYNIVYGTGQSTPKIYNCIFWNNDSNIASLGSAAPDYRNNLENIDPEYIASNDYRLTPNSPAVNAGENLLNDSSLDLDGNLRIEGNFIDLGAYENMDLCNGIVPGIIYVDDSATGSNNGDCWANAYTTLDAAIAEALDDYFASRPIQTIWVAAGMYDGDIRMVDNVAIFGSFLGGERSVEQRPMRSTEADWTIIDEDIDGSEVRNTLFLAGGTSQDTIDGLWLKNGESALAITSTEYGTFLVRDCVLSNSSSDSGLRLEANFGIEVTVENTSFIDNYSTVYQGAAINVRDKDANNVVNVSNCYFSGNLSSLSTLPILPIAIMNIENATVNIHSSVFDCNTIYNSLWGSSQSANVAYPRMTLNGNTFNLGDCPYSYPAIFVERGEVKLTGQNTINE